MAPDPQPQDPSITTLRVCGVGALLVTSLLMLDGGGPSVLNPWPMAIVLPSFGLGPFALVLVPGAFLAWSWTGLRAPARPPLAEGAMAALFGSLNAWWLVGHWHWGIQYQGAVTARGVLAANLLVAGALTALLVWTILRPSHGRALVLRFGICLWLGWCAFPWFGEMP